MYIFIIASIVQLLSKLLLQILVERTKYRCINALMVELKAILSNWDNILHSHTLPYHIITTRNNCMFERSQIIMYVHVCVCVCVCHRGLGWFPRMIFLFLHTCLQWGSNPNLPITRQTLYTINHRQPKSYILFTSKSRDK